MKSRFHDWRRKLKLALAGLVGGFAAACAPNPPGEAPPLAPRPEPVQPMPGSEQPVPGAPDPSAPKFPPDDAQAPGAPPPIVEPGFVYQRAAQLTDGGVPMQVTDGGPSDALAPLPPVPDAGVPADASTQPVSDGGPRVR